MVYPLTTRTAGKTIPVVIVLIAIFFNTVNGWTNGVVPRPRLGEL